MAVAVGARVGGAHRRRRASKAESKDAAIIEMRIRPDPRRRGIATDFIRTLIPVMRAEGCTRVIGSADVPGPVEFWGASVGMRPTPHLAAADQTRWERSARDGCHFRSGTAAALEDMLASYGRAGQTCSGRSRAGRPNELEVRRHDAPGPDRAVPSRADGDRSRPRHRSRWDPASGPAPDPAPDPAPAPGLGARPVQTSSGVTAAAAA